ncbi:MAG: ribosomal-protein-alanine N-acetyltransferase [Ruminococcaceae bacterium]|nr:ribosomal-protein-alanine N-acetyltransferase [Oscillospiraceae bacterium]
MTAQRLEKEHLAAVAALERETFKNPWSEQALALLCGEMATGVVVMDGARAAAYGGMMCVAGEGQITNIGTSPDYRRRGLGTAVMAALIAEAQARGLCEISLEVRESNVAAIALYEKFGFRMMGKRPRFYTNPTETAFVMLLALGGAE